MKRAIALIVFCGILGCRRDAPITFIPKGDTNSIQVPPETALWIRKKLIDLERRGRSTNYIEALPYGTFVIGGKQMYWESTNLYVSTSPTFDTWRVLDVPEFEGASEKWLTLASKHRMTTNEAWKVVSRLRRE